MANATNRIAIGFLEEPDEESRKRFKCKFFPSKAGGKPVWLGLSPIPSQDQLKCPHCFNQLTFVLQIYVPNDWFEDTFHRTMYLFACTIEFCCKGFKVFRSQLKRTNKFYASSPPNWDDTSDNPDDPSVEKFGEHVCNACGLTARQNCAKCKSVYYCSRDHQIADWKEGNHKNVCGKSLENADNDGSKLTSFLLPEYDIVVEIEDFTGENEDDEDEDVSEDDNEDKGGDNHGDEKSSKRKNLSFWLEKYKPQFQDENLEEYVTDMPIDKVFNYFKKRISGYEDQIFRYYHATSPDQSHPMEPLWISESNKPDSIPNCPNCGSERCFEFQIMPQLIYQLKATFDFGILAIYSCKRNCSPQSEGDYLEEYVWVQNIE